MAVIRASRSLAPNHDALVARLVDELTHDTRSGQPFIYVNDVGQTGKVHVTVIWDGWSKVSGFERAKIIVDAVERHDPSMVGNITIAMGLTGEQARRLGLLPYKVQLLGNGQKMNSALENLLRREGGFETSEGLQLLFHSPEQANLAYQRLQAASPNDHWALVHEESTSD